MQGILLTGDGKLRKHSMHVGIKVHGILYLLDQMLFESLLTFSQAIEKLIQLSEINNRLPKKEIKKRLKDWKEKK